MIRFCMLAIENLEQHLLRFFLPLPAVVQAGYGQLYLPPTSSSSIVPNPAIWFAVPKNRVTRSRKRIKNWKKRQIPIREDIVRDLRTGEITLMHRLPFNWRDHLPAICHKDRETET
ncbi:hypothetical protein ACA910_013314 [Epithemia clementina (nom. ined.)]